MGVAKFSGMRPHTLTLMVVLGSGIVLVGFWGDGIKVEGGDDGGRKSLEIRFSGASLFDSILAALPTRMG